MSEELTCLSEHFLNLKAYSAGLVMGLNGKNLYDRYKSDLESITAVETMQILDFLLQQYPFEIVKKNVGKLINICYKSLIQQIWHKPAESHLISLMMQENRGVEKIIADLRLNVKAFFSCSRDEKNKFASQMLEQIKDLRSYELHYIKKENIIFPYIESTFPQYRCLKLMWSFHDDFRKSVRTIEGLLMRDPIENDLLNKELGRLFFVVLPLIFREEQIIYPVAYRAIPESAWAEMLVQAHETGWCYIDPPVPEYLHLSDKNNPEGSIDLGTGVLDREQIIKVFESLPVDITFVDESDTVKYFSGSKHRIFPRSKAIIGRKVQNCHPPESVHVVNQIIEAFRMGTKKDAEFWIRLKGQFIYIRYIALFSSQGEYKGTIEVSQDITDIRLLDGERRLLSWEE